VKKAWKGVKQLLPDFVEGGLKNTRGTPLRLRALVHSFKLLLRFYEMIFALGFLVASDGVIEYTRSN